ncbi:flippase [Enterococcus sp. LJL120]
MFKSKSLAANALLNTIRQFCAIAFPLVTFPYISRVLQVENYGKFTFSNSVVSYFALIAALGISNYAVREGSSLREDKKRLSVFADEVFSINVFTTIFSYILLIIALLLFQNLRDYKVLVLIQSLTIFFTTIGVEWLYTIYEDFAYVTLRSIIVQFVALIMMFIFVKTPNDYVTYAWISVLASGGANIFGFFYSRKYIHLKLVIVKNFKEHIKPMGILFFNTLAITIYANSGITLLGILKDNQSVGLYNVSVRIYTIIKQLLNATVVVILPRASLYLRQGRQEEYQKLILTVFRFLAILVVPATVGLYFMSYQITYFIAGDSYTSGFTSLRILSFAIILSIFASFITVGILLPHRREKKILIATVAGAVVNFILNITLIPFLDFNGAAIATVLAELVVFCFSIYFAKDIFDFKIIMGSFKAPLVGSILIGIVCTIVNLKIDNNFWSLIISVSVSIVAYSATLIGFYWVDLKIKK